MRGPAIVLFAAAAVAAMAATSVGGGPSLGWLFAGGGDSETLGHARPAPVPERGRALAQAELVTGSTPAATGSPAGANATPPAPPPAASPPPSQAEDAPASGKSAGKQGRDIAQDVPALPAAGNAPPQAAPVDETALRYFARQGDTKRLQAEIARLKALYPDWTPPADPAAIPPQSDPRLDAMWKLYAGGKYAELRKAVADRQLAEPGWAPPADLLKLLGLGEAHETLLNASNLKQYETVIRIASQNPSLLVCGDVDALWRVAEAFAKTERMQRAQDAYLYILKNCNDPHERLATVEKAIPLLPEAMVQDLLSTERPGKDGKGEFEEARAEILRNRISHASADKAGKPLSDQDLEAMTVLADRTGEASDYRLLGWYLLNHAQPEKAADWFRKAGAKKPDADTAQGLGLALVRLQKPREAEDALYPFHDASDDIRKVYLAAVANMLAIQPPPDFTPEVLQRIVPVIFKARDAASAQQLGWYARALNQDATAAEWFHTAIGWKADDEPSAYGLALTLQRMGKRQELENLQREWRGRSDRIAMVGKASQAQPETVREAHPASETAAIGRPGQGEVSTVPARAGVRPQARDCRTGSSTAGLDSDAALAYGWCLMRLDRPAEATAAFQVALDRGAAATRRDAAWGQSLAYLRLGQTAKASVAAAREPQDGDRRRQLESSILEQRARAFFEAKRFTETLMALDARKRVTAETLDLMMLRGYAYLGLRRYDDARVVFEAVAATGDHAGIRGLADVNASAE